MFASDRTCCVRNERGQSIQLHHIDEDPSNNVSENLAVLRLQRHDETQVTGGFGRKLNADLVIEYRDKWYVRVRSCCEDADRDAVRRLVGSKKRTPQIGTIEYSEERTDAILEYVNSLLKYRKELWRKLQPELDTGVTARVAQASYDHIASLQGVLVTMAGFYPEGNFDGEERHLFFPNQLSATFS